MFLGIRPYVAVVTNVEHDHPDCYPTPQDFYQAFLQFTHQVQPGGVLVACSDDPGARKLLEEAQAAGVEAISYGLGDGLSGYQAVNLQPNAEGGLTFESASSAHRAVPSSPELVALQVPGEHNVRNALAALSVADRLGFELPETVTALHQFLGAGRRFDVRGDFHGVTLVDDYAHHPTEIRATLAAARLRYPYRRLWAVWQPHTYSRTRALFEAFSAAFDVADGILVTEIFPARESAPADGFSVPSGPRRDRLAAPERR